METCIKHSKVFVFLIEINSSSSFKTCISIKHSKVVFNQNQCEHLLKIIYIRKLKEEGCSICEFIQVILYIELYILCCCSKTLRNVNKKKRENTRTIRNQNDKKQER